MHRFGLVSASDLLARDPDGDLRTFASFGENSHLEHVEGAEVGSRPGWPRGESDDDRLVAVDAPQAQDGRALRRSPAARTSSRHGPRRSSHHENGHSRRNTSWGSKMANRSDVEPLGEAPAGEQPALGCCDGERLLAQVRRARRRRRPARVSVLREEPGRHRHECASLPGARATAAPGHAGSRHRSSPSAPSSTSCADRREAVDRVSDLLVVAILRPGRASTWVRSTGTQSSSARKGRSRTISGYQRKSKSQGSYGVGRGVLRYSVDERAVAAAVDAERIEARRPAREVADETPKRCQDWGA